MVAYPLRPRDFDRYPFLRNMKRIFLIIGVLVLALALLFAVDRANRGPRYVGGPVTIVDGKAPKYGMLGVTLDDPTKALTITEVLTDSPAYLSGLKVGDTILAIDNTPIQSRDHFIDSIQATRPGDDVMIRVLRAGTELDLSVELCDFASIIELRARYGPGHDSGLRTIDD